MICGIAAPSGRSLGGGFFASTVAYGGAAGFTLM